MALEEDLKAVRKELSAQEKMLETFIKSERFLRKYKYIFLALFLLIIAYFIYTGVAQSMAEGRLLKNNELYASLLEEPKNAEKIELLKQANPNLYALFIFSNEGNFTAELEELKNLNIHPLLKELISADSAALNESLFLRHFNTLMSAYDLLKQGDIKGANTLLNQIPLDSSLRALAENFRHYKGIQ